jgi:TetR/AcrR family transcriptional regulator
MIKHAIRTTTGLPTAEEPLPVHDTRQKLIDAARTLLAERNSLDVPLAEITGRAGVNIALVSYHFRGREGLLIEIARADAKLALGLLDRLLASGLDPAEKLRRHIIGIVKFYCERPYLNRLIHALLRDGSHAAAAGLVEFFVLPLNKGREQIFGDGLRAGMFRDVDPRILSFAIDGACENILVSNEAREASFGYSRFDQKLQDEHANMIADLFVSGLRPPNQMEG